MCRNRTVFPRAATAARVTENRCGNPACSGALLIEFRFRRTQIPPGYDPVMVACYLCNDRLKQLLSDTGLGRAGAGGGEPLAAAGAAAAIAPNPRGHGSGAGSRGRATALANERAGSVIGPGSHSGRGRGRGVMPGIGPHIGGGRAREADGERGHVRESQGDSPCPGCGLPLLRRTSNTAANPGREFLKCESSSEPGCVSFSWADELEGGERGASQQAGRGNERGRGRRGGR